MIIDRYIIRHFIPVFIAAAGMFVLLIVLIDLFMNLVTYLNYEAPLTEILRASLYYTPKSFSFALPISLLFAVAYTLGDLYMRNELTTIIMAGVPSWRVSLPLIIIGAFASVFAFFFDDNIVVPTYREKNILTRQLKHQRVSENNADIFIKTLGGNRIYSVDFYDYRNRILNGVTVIEKDEYGNFFQEIRAASARWEDGHWVFNNPVVYARSGDDIKVDPMISTAALYNEDPELFRRSAVDPDDLPAKDAADLVNDLRNAGLPYVKAQSNVYHRYSFPAVSFIVVVLSISMSGRFRKNILMMSLLVSLLCAVVYYVVEMISMMLGELSYIPPITAAWFPVFLFIIIGGILVRFSKT